MVKVILYYQDQITDDREFSSKTVFAENEAEFWSRYYNGNEYIKCEDECEGTFSVYLKKDKIIEIWFEKGTGEWKWIKLH